MAAGNFIGQKIRSFRYYGGKAGLARRIVSLIPDHQTYLEPFAGGLNVLLNKYRSHREITCDLNTDLVHFYHTLVNSTQELCDRVRLIQRSEEMFLTARDSQEDDPVSRAVNFLVKHQLSRNAIGRHYSVCDDSTKYVNWDTFPDHLELTADRLRGVEIRNQSAFDVLDEFNTPEVCAYLDPPYYPSSRVSPKIYKHEMTAFEHVRLLRRLQNFQGKVILSGYGNPLYDQELRDWERYEFVLPNNSSQQKEKPLSTEVLWVKPHQVF